MANVIHNTLTGVELHEEKLVSTAGTGDTGKVVTPSGTVANTGELRNLVFTEINSKTHSQDLYIKDISTASTDYVVAAYNGTLTNVWSVIDGAVAAGGDTTLTIKINNISVSPSDIVITQSGSAAGDVDTVTPTTLNTFSQGDTLEVVGDGGAGTNVDATVTFLYTIT